MWPARELHGVLQPIVDTITFDPVMFQPIASRSTVPEGPGGP